MFTLEKATKIATSYDITDKKLIQEEFEYCVEIAKTSPKSAEHYFDGHMADTVAFERADAKAHSKFLMDAYGE